MSIHLTVPPKRELKPRIVVFGIGGAGGNAVNNMVSAGLEGVDFVVANTDAQALAASQADRRIQMGSKLTEGLGAGSNPKLVVRPLRSRWPKLSICCRVAYGLCHAGMGGGTGTGAAPVIARAARELGVLTVGVVTKPFDFEGTRRMRSANEGINELARKLIRSSSFRTRTCSASQMPRQHLQKPSQWPMKCCIRACPALPIL